LWGESLKNYVIYSAFIFYLLNPRLFKKNKCIFCSARQEEKQPHKPYQSCKWPILHLYFSKVSIKNVSILSLKDWWALNSDMTISCSWGQYVLWFDEDFWLLSRISHKNSVFCPKFKAVGVENPRDTKALHSNRRVNV